MSTAGIRGCALALACAAAAVAQDRCACPDARVFSLGAALFGQKSARVVIAGFEPELLETSGRVARCSGIQAVGQTIELNRSISGRPYLQRETRKRGVIRDVCRTQIRFVQSAKSYDFFADDGGAVTLDETTPANPSPLEATTEDFSEDLTGRDLLQFDSRSRPVNPSSSAFDQEDLKETAYVIVRKRVKAAAYAGNGGTAGEVTINAGTLGRIEKRAGNRSEPLWNVELFPESAPAPFWRAIPVSPRQGRRASNWVILASSQIAEINSFFDRYGWETTRFGAAAARQTDRPGTMDLPRIFYRPKPPLNQNVAEAQASGAIDSIERALAKMVLLPEELGVHFLILGESGEAAQPDLLSRQCFVQTGLTREPLEVVEARVKVFRPAASSQITSEYYAIDLDLALRSASAKARTVCRFPFDPINLTLVDRARRILSARFKVEP